MFGGDDPGSKQSSCEETQIPFGNDNKEEKAMGDQVVRSSCETPFSLFDGWRSDFVIIQR